MKKIIFILSVVFATSASAQRFVWANYSVAERDSLRMTISDFQDDKVQLRLSGSAKLVKIEKSAKRELTKKGFVKETKTSAKSEMQFPDEVLGTAVLEKTGWQRNYSIKGDTTRLGGKITSIKIDSIPTDSTFVIWVKFDEFENYPLPFASNGASSGQFAAGNSYALATGRFPIITFNDEKYQLTGSGSLQFKRKKKATDDTDLKIARGSRVGGH